jgi:apolipoprotein N-acyltransferase
MEQHDAHTDGPMLLNVAREWDRDFAPRDNPQAEFNLNIQPQLSLSRLRPQRLQLALASLSGVLAVLALSFSSAAALGWLVLLPLLWVIDRAVNLRRALWLAWWAGLIASFGGLQWMIGLMTRFLGFPWLAAAAIHGSYCAYQALVWLLFAAIVWLGRKRLALPMVAVVPVALVAAEVLIPYLYPYGLELSQAGFPMALQIADLTGRFGVTVLLGLGAAGAYDLLWPAHSARRLHRISALAALAIVVGALAYGVVRLQAVNGELRDDPVARIGIVQPNSPIDAPGMSLGRPHRPLPPPETRLAALHARSAELARAGAELVLWPETSYPALYPRERLEDFPADDSRSASAGLKLPLIIGTISVRAADWAQYNSALLLSPSGQIVATYDKVNLLPFGEYIPSWIDFQWVRQLAFGAAPGLHPGSQVRAINIPTTVGARAWSVGLLICYEDILAGATRQLGAQHPDFFADLSNDAWFESRREVWQHIGLAVFGAVEQRTSLIRAANPGGSALIDPAGRIRWQSPLVDTADAAAHPQAWLVDVPLRQAGNTVYSFTGPVLPISCVLLTAFILAAAGIAPYKGRRSKET